ncbi:MAG: hypothetical protein ACW99U_15600 [Candidatus Thorarchaeota archaeon]
MDWQELTFGIASVVIAGIIMYYVGRVGWFRNVRKETAQKRLDGVLIPIKCEFDKVMTKLQVTGELLFHRVVDYDKELRDLHETIEESYSFDILRTRNPRLFARIEGFFRDLQHLEHYEKDMANETWKMVYNSIEDDKVNQNIGGKSGIHDKLLLAIVLNWDEPKLLRRHGQKLREILSGSRDVDDDLVADYVTGLYSQIKDMASVKGYVKYREHFLKQAEVFIKTLSEQIEGDKKLMPG